MAEKKLQIKIETGFTRAWIASMHTVDVKSFRCTEGELESTLRDTEYMGVFKTEKEALEWLMKKLEAKSEGLEEKRATLDKQILAISEKYLELSGRIRKLK